jgi:hypothetical protein
MSPVTRFQSETLPLLAKDPALILRADSAAPVFNDEEKLARTTTQVHKVARDRYRFDVGTITFWAGCDRATTLVAGARHVEPHPHGMCQLIHKRFAPSWGASGPVVRPKSRGVIPFVSLGKLHTSRRGTRRSLATGRDPWKGAAITAMRCWSGIRTPRWPVRSMPSSVLRTRSAVLGQNARKAYRKVLVDGARIKLATSALRTNGGRALSITSRRHLSRLYYWYENSRVDT